ncbi:hypothetical protein M5D96_003030 [Drosophila gunungcola]|uniref:Andropin n=1 Tax=Drosophila gunungcola TaxID=103775 RepID=A0A9Q0BW22_9MUSC|nr:hypothetical protein M5D96_003030 [Drosophila gunungcola]
MNFVSFFFFVGLILIINMAQSEALVIDLVQTVADKVKDIADSGLGTVKNATKCIIPI